MPKHSVFSGVGCECGVSYGILITLESEILTIRIKVTFIQKSGFYLTCVTISVLYINTIDNK